MSEKRKYPRINDIKKISALALIAVMAVISGFTGCDTFKTKTSGSSEQLPPTSKSEGNRIIQEEGGETVKIIDEDGKLIKEISLKPETIFEEEKTEDDTGSIKTRKIKKEIRKRAVCKNGRFVGIVSNERDVAVINNETGEEISSQGEGKATGKITILDVDGKVLLEKKLSESRWVHYQPLISDNVEYIAVFSQLTAYAPTGLEPRDIIYVFDRNGKEVITFPAEEDYKSGYRASDIPQAMSPDGRYLAIYIEKDVPNKKSPTMTRFYDLKKNTYWDSQEQYAISEITNEGIAKVSYPNPDIRENDPYEKRIKQGVISETINLKDFLEK